MTMPTSMHDRRGAGDGMSGSTQDGLSKRRSRRLSKPRTNASSAGGALRLIKSQAELGSPVGSTKPSSPPDMSSTAIKRSSARSWNRPALHQVPHGPSKQQHPDGEDEGDQAARAHGNKNRGIKERLTRTTSTMISKRASFRRSLGSFSRSASHPATDAAPELDPGLSSRIIEEIKEKVFYDQLAASFHPPSPLDTEINPIRIISPIRRRSLLTPGLATRTPDDILRKPPLPGRHRTELNRDRHPGSSLNSTLGRIAALDLADQGRGSPLQRSSTPTDFDYGHLGYLGQLRVTNGVESPVPSVRYTLSQGYASGPSLNGREDYFTASRGAQTDDEDSGVSTGMRSPDDSDVSPHGDTSAPCKDLDEMEMRGRSLHPRRPTCAQERSRSDYSQSARWPVPSPRPSLVLTIPNASPHLEGTSVVQKAANVDGDRTTLLARDYISELPSSPFTSRSSFGRIDDGLLDNGIAGFTAPISDSRTVSLVPATRSNLRRNSDEKAADALYAIEATVRGPPFDLGNRASVLSAKAQSVSAASTRTNSDSGYGSSTSLKSLGAQGAPNRAELPPSHVTTAKESAACGAPLGPHGMLGASSLTLNGLLHVTPPGNNATAAPCHDPADIIGPKRLQKRSTPNSQARPEKKTRPVSQPPPSNHITVQNYRELSSGHVSPVAAKVAVKPSEGGLERFPSFEDAASTQWQVAAGVKAFNPTISVNQPYYQIRFPTPTHNYSDATHKASHVPDATPTKSDKRWISWRRRASSKSSRTERQETLEPVFDLAELQHSITHVAQSLGSSPYGPAALAYMPKKTRPCIYPHQPTMAKSAAECPVDMDKGQNAGPVKTRGHHRSTSLPGSAESSTAPPVPEKSARRPFNDRGGIPGKMPRPGSIYVDAPPLPALPSPQQVGEKEVRFSRIRPYSMIPTVLRNPGQLNKRDQNSQDPFDWEAQRKAWADHRRSAGDALLHQYSTVLAPIKPLPPPPHDNRSFAFEETYLHAPPLAIIDASHLEDRVLTAAGYEPLLTPKNLGIPMAPVHVPALPPVTASGNKPLSVPSNANRRSRNFHLPLIPPLPNQYTPPITQPPTPTFNIQSELWGPDARKQQQQQQQQQRQQRLPGRFDGGLEYGYEPATRSTGTGATVGKRGGFAREQG